MNYYTIDTGRLILRQYDEAVLNHIHETMSDQQIMDFMGITTPEELQLEKERYRRGMSTQATSFYMFHVIHKETSAVMGWCGYHTWNLKHDRAELGYTLNSDEFKRKGFMTEALLPVLDYGFHTMNLHRIEALIAPYNTPSLRLLQKHNFKKEGVLREHYKVNGVNEDSIMYSLLKNEFSQ